MEDPHRRYIMEITRDEIVILRTAVSHVGFRIDGNTKLNMNKTEYIGKRERLEKRTEVTAVISNGGQKLTTINHEVNTKDRGKSAGPNAEDITVDTG